eukprot:362856-Chlamydomonas_euryale.AAC.15
MHVAVAGRPPGTWYTSPTQASVQQKTFTLALWLKLTSPAAFLLAHVSAGGRRFGSPVGHRLRQHGSQAPVPLHASQQWHHFIQMPTGWFMTECDFKALTSNGNL